MARRNKRRLTGGESVTGLFILVAMLAAAFPIITIAGVVAIPVAIAIVVGVWYKATRVNIGPSHFQGMPAFPQVARSVASKFPVLIRYESDTLQETLEVRCTRRFRRIRAKKDLLVMCGPMSSLIIAPATYWSRRGDHHSMGLTSELRLKPFAHKFKTSRLDDQEKVLYETWEHTTKSGDRDCRYKDNREVYVVQRYGFTIGLEDGTRWKFAELSKSGCMAVTRMMSAIFGDPISTDAELERLFETDEEADQYDQSEDDGRMNFDFEETEPNDDDKSDDPELKVPDPESPWFEVLGVSQDASLEEIKSARDKLMMEYHPDRAEGLAPEIRRYTNRRAQLLNAAYEKAVRLHRAR